MNCFKYLLVILFFTPNLLFAQNREPLKLNSTITLKVKKGESKVFSLQLSKGESYCIQAEQKGIDLSLNLQDSVGNELYYMDSPNGKYGPEIINLAPKNHTSFLLVIKPLDESENSNKGKMTLTLTNKITIDDPIQRNTVLSTKQMHNDLSVFRSIGEKANSGLYRYRTKMEIDSVYSLAYAKTKEPLTTTEFFKVILELSDIEGSCHNSVSLPYEILSYLPKDKGFFPYYLRTIEGEMIVNNTDGLIPLGSRIVSINGVADTVLMQRFFKYQTTDGYNVTVKQKSSVDNSYGWRFPFEFGIQDSFIVQFQKPYSPLIETITVKSSSLAEKESSYMKLHSAPFDSVINPEIQEKYSYQKIDSNIVLLNFRGFDMSDGDEDPRYAEFCYFLDSVFLDISQQQISNLIIDVRNNPGGSGSNSEKTFTYLAEKPFRENTLAYINFKTIPHPEHFKWNSSDKKNQKREQKDTDEYLQSVFTQNNGDGTYSQDSKFNPYFHPDSNRFKGNLYLLVDETVASAASHFASYVRGHTNAKIIGMETTGGYYGHNGHFPVEYVLPNSKISTRFSIVYVEQDAPKMDSQPIGRGIIPDYHVSRSFDDFMKNEDTQMKFVLKMIRN